jgi:hypothetical protein
MKHVISFDEFINEQNNPLLEGAMASSVYKMILKDAGSMQDSMDADDSFEDEYKAIAKVLKTTANKVVQVDSETHEDDPKLTKVYKFLENNFIGSEDVPGTDPGMGQDIRFDPNLEVVRLDDYGFVGFFFTDKAKF